MRHALGNRSKHRTIKVHQQLQLVCAHVSQRESAAGLLNEDATLLQYRDISAADSGQTDTIKASQLVSMNPFFFFFLLHQASSIPEGHQRGLSTHQVSPAVAEVGLGCDNILRPPLQHLGKGFT